jgi:hypothetical protein
MELEWLKKSLSCSNALELRKLVDHDHPELSVSRQCALLGFPRSTLYYRPIPVRDSTLRIMTRIDALYLEDPCSGSRRMVDYLARDGIPISRDRARSLTRRMGLRAILRKPRTTVPPLSLPGGCQHGHGCGSGLGQRRHLHPSAERLPLLGGDRGSLLQERAQLEALQQP